MYAVCWYRNGLIHTDLYIFKAMLYKYHLKANLMDFGRTVYITYFVKVQPIKTWNSYSEPYIAFNITLHLNC